MFSIKTSTKIKVWGTKNSWSLAPHRNLQEPNQECNVDLEIQGNDREGYLLIMSPEGFFTADSWHPTKEDALDSARSLFDIAPEDWSPRQKENG